MVLQTIRGIHGIKDTGAEWYKLLALILTKELGMIPATSNNSLFYWQQDGNTVFVSLTTDDILLAATDISFYIRIQQAFDNYFAYTIKEGAIL